MLHLQDLLFRLIQSIVLLILVSVIVFGLIHMAPGLPAIIADTDIGKDDQQRILEDLGLDQPLHVQYIQWANRILNGDLGDSLLHRRPVWDLVSGALPGTLLLAGTSLLLAVAIAIPIGIISALRPYSLIDYVTTVISFFGISIPGFWYAILLIILFGITLGWFPTSGIRTIGKDPSLLDNLHHLVLPALVVSTSVMATLTRYTRSSMLEVLHQDYIRTARAKGLREPVVVTRHALRNALFPVMTVIGLLLPRLIGGSAVIELVFAWPGIGRLAIVSALSRDYPVVMAITLLISGLTIVSNQAIDLLYSYLDPRLSTDAKRS